MKEVKKCSISGVAFTMDADAYQELENYLDSLKKTYKDTPDGAEIVADIEARIAELILTTQDNTRVVEKPLILNIIHQMGSVEDISEESSDKKATEEPRIPRRLYRDTENAKLGGVCAGIGKYFDVDPVWIRLGMFLPILLSFLHWIPFMDWTGPMMGNLFGIFVICYVIMWFAVPAARTARQKLEMNGEKITAQSIRETTEATAGCDPDVRAKPIVAEAVSVFGKVVLILLKLFAGLLVFGLIMGAWRPDYRAVRPGHRRRRHPLAFLPAGHDAVGTYSRHIYCTDSRHTAHLCTDVPHRFAQARRHGRADHLPAVARKFHRMRLHCHPRGCGRPVPRQA